MVSRGDTWLAGAVVTKFIKAWAPAALPEPNWLFQSPVSLGSRRVRASQLKVASSSKMGGRQARWDDAGDPLSTQSSDRPSSRVTPAAAGVPKEPGPHARRKGLEKQTGDR